MADVVLFAWLDDDCGGGKIPLEEDSPEPYRVARSVLRALASTEWNDDQIRDALYDGVIEGWGEGYRWMTGSTYRITWDESLRRMRDIVAPVLAAKDARIVEAEQDAKIAAEQFEAACETIGELQERVAALKAQLSSAKSSVEWHVSQARAATVALGCTGMTLEEAVRDVMERIDALSSVSFWEDPNDA